MDLIRILNIEYWIFHESEKHNRFIIHQIVTKKHFQNKERHGCLINTAAKQQSKQLATLTSMECDSHLQLMIVKRYK